VGKDTSPGIARQTQKPKPATSVVKKVTSYVCSRELHLSCLVILAPYSRVNAQNPTLSPTHRAEVAKNATSAGRSATSLVPAPNPPVLEEALTPVVTVAEATTLLVVVVEKPGMIDHQFIIINSRTHITRLIATLVVVLGTFLAIVDRVPSVTTVLDSYELHFPTSQLLLTTHSSI
jgi:hypothetical protein